MSLDLRVHFLGLVNAVSSRVRPTKPKRQYRKMWSLNRYLMPSKWRICNTAKSRKYTLCIYLRDGRSTVTGRWQAVSRCLTEPDLYDEKHAMNDDTFTLVF